MEIFSKFQIKVGNKSHNLTYCFSFQTVVVYNFSEIESTFPVSFWDYVAGCWWLDMVFMCLIRRGRYDWFVHERLPLDWLISVQYLLQSACCSKYVAKTANCYILNVFLRFLHPFVLKHFRIFVAKENIQQAKNSRGCARKETVDTDTLVT